MTAIPVSQLVSVTPAVQAPGGSNLVATGLLLTNSTMTNGGPRFPVGSVLSFSSQAAVGTYAGTSSTEYALAGNYFAGYDNSLKKPASLLIATVAYGGALPAYLRSSSFGNATFVSSPIASGALTLVIDGATFAATGINLTGQTSYSGVASTVQTALQAAQPTSASATGSTISATTFTVGTIVSGTFAVGQVISGTGVTANTILTALLTGNGGSGSTFTVSISQTTASTTITGKPQLPTVFYDTVSSSYVVTSGSTGATSTMAAAATGNVATFMQITSAFSPTASQGAAQVTGAGVATAMNAIVAINNNWGGFTSVFEPTTADKLQFAAWVSPLPYWWSMWDTITAAAATQPSDTTSAGYQITNTYGYSGIHCITYDPSYSTTAALQATAAFAIGVNASINYAATNGRVTWAYRTQSGLAATVVSGTIAANIASNTNLAGTAPIYNFYGAYANAGNGFVSYQAGSISGPFTWLDSYTNQIWLNNNCQTSFVQLLQAIGNIPYSPAGYALLRQALYNGSQTVSGSQPSAAAVGPVAAALNFGAIRVGVVLSANQILAVNNAAGLAIDGYLNTQGFYIQIKDPGATVRVARGSPLCYLWYMDGQSVQKINLTSTDVQ